MLSFFSRDALDEIWDLIESVSEALIISAVVQDDSLHNSVINVSNLYDKMF